MNRTKFFTFRLNQRERKMLASVAGYFERSQSDVLRLLLRSAFRELNSTKEQAAFDQDDRNYGNNETKIA